MVSIAAAEASSVDRVFGRWHRSPSTMRPDFVDYTVSLRIGTSGWNYPTGRGHMERRSSIRRPSAPRAAGFDELRFYAEQFDTVEVNSHLLRAAARRASRAAGPSARRRASSSR